MKSSKTLPPVLAILLCISLSCSFLKDKFAGGGKPATEFTRIAKLPRPNLDGPIVSPGAVAVRKLAEVDPSVTALAVDIEKSERGAMKQIITANSSSRETKNASLIPTSNEPRTAARAFGTSDGRPVTALMMFQTGDIPLPGMNDGALVGMIAGQFKSMFSDVPSANFTKKDSRTEISEGTTTTMDVEVGGHEDGSTVFGLGLKTESTKNGVKVTTEMHAKIEGNECPNAEGQVQITVKARISARSGSSGYTQDITTFIRVQVDDSANISATTIDVEQATSRGKNGQEVYVQTGETVKFGPDYSDGTISNQRVIQKTDNAGDSDIQEAWTSGQGTAYGAAIGAITMAESSWKDGKCIQIEATAPGSVAPGSSTEVPVKVRHRKDGTEVVAKVDAKLTGEASIAPSIIPKTPGTLTYVAPGETDKTATIKLKATCRRGIATLDLPADTGRKSYRASGKQDSATFTGDICSLNRPFEIGVTSITGAWPMKFTPSSELAGQMEGTFTAGDCNLTGGGPYSVVLKEDGTGTLTFTYNSTATCPAGSRTTSKTTTLKLTPAPDLKCQ